MYHTLLACLLSFSMTIFCIKFLKPVSVRLNLLDHPGGRKQHEQVRPLIGGLAIFIGFCFAMLSLPLSLIGFRPFAAGALLLIMVGILDDMHELSARARFIAEIFAGLLVTLWAGLVMKNLGSIFSTESLQLSYLAIPFTIFGLVGLINAVNMLDGSDGLAGSISLCHFFFFFLAACYAHRMIDARVILFLMAAIAGFLVFNFPFKKRQTASIFMGDAGSMFLGYALSWFSISLSQGDFQALSPISVAWILAFTIWDAMRVVATRLIKGESPFAPDRRHWHHVLEDLSYSARERCLFTLLMASITASIGLLGQCFAWDQRWLFVGFFIGFLFYILGMAILDTQVRNRLCA